MASWITPEMAERIKASQAEFPELPPKAAAWAWLGKHLPPWLNDRDRRIAIQAYEDAGGKHE